jgi:CheY-like chemotaxis protein
MWLPVAEGASATVPRQSKPSRNTPPPAHVPRLTILAVDDDALVLMNTTAMLEELGHRAIEASSGPQALALVRGDPSIDVVVTDYAMPGLTGGDLVRSIHAERPALPVVLATGYAELPAGAEVDAVRLPKPFGQPELARAVAAAVRRRESVGAPVDG